VSCAPTITVSVSPIQPAAVPIPIAAKAPRSAVASETNTTDAGRIGPL
jgi:hypothetical protein